MNECFKCGAPTDDFICDECREGDDYGYEINDTCDWCGLDGGVHTPDCVYADENEDNIIQPEP